MHLAFAKALRMDLGEVLNLDADRYFDTMMNRWAGYR